MHKNDSEENAQCDQCGKGFGHKTGLKAHMTSTHLKHRPYNCRYACFDNFGYNNLSNRSIEIVMKKKKTRWTF